MTYPTGQVLSAPITNGSPIAQFGTHIDYLGMGGYRSVTTLADRDAIPTKSALEYDGLGSGMRRHLMLVGVQETGLIYILNKPGFLALGADAVKLAALKDNSNWQLLTDFLNIKGGGTPTPNELSADQLAAIQAAAAPSTTNRFLTATELASVAFPMGTSTPTVFYVQGFGQTTTPQPGNPLRPYNTIQEAVDAANANDTIIILPGGSSVDYLGRKAYSNGVNITKDLNIIFQGGVASGYWVFGVYPGSLSTIKVSVKNGIWTNGLAVIGSNGQQCRYYFDNCSFEDKTTVYQLVPSGFEQTNNKPGLDVQYFTNCHFNNANPVNGDGVFKFQSRDDATATQHVNIILQDCQVESAYTPIATGYSSIYHLIHLRGSTALLVDSSQPLQIVTRANSAVIISDNELIIDERNNKDSSNAPKSGIYELDEYTATVDGVQNISLPSNVKNVFDIKVLEFSGGCRPIYQKHYNYINSVLSILNESKIKAGDKISGYGYAEIVNISNLVQVVIISGQSNAQGLAKRSDLYTGSLSTITPSLTREFQRVKIWNPSSSAWEKLKVGASGFTGSGGGNELGQQGSEHPNSYEDGFGPEIGMAQRWEQSNSTDTLYIIKAALGGTSIDRWEKSANDLYQSRLNAYFIESTANLTKSGLTPVIKGFLWIQGETDAPTANTYQSRLSTFLDNVQNDFLEANTIRVIGGLLPNNGYDGIIAAQQAYANSMANTFWNDASGYGHITNDTIHVGAASMLQLGAIDAYNKLFQTSGSIDVVGSIPNGTSTPINYLAKYKSYEGNNTLSQWNDLSGNGFHLTQPDTSKQYRFLDDTDKRYYNNGGKPSWFNIPVLTTDKKDLTIILCCQSVSNKPQYMADFYKDSSNRLIMAIQGGDGAYFDGDFHGEPINTIITPTVSNPTVIIYRLNSSGASVRVNGVTKNSNIPYTPQALFIGRLGCEADSLDGHGAYLEGNIFAFMVYSGNMTDSEVLSVENELKTDLNLSF